MQFIQLIRMVTESEYPVHSTGCQHSASNNAHDSMFDIPSAVSSGPKSSGYDAGPSGELSLTFHFSSVE